MKKIWAAVGLLSLIGVGVILRRLVASGHNGLDEGFAEHRTLTLIHILPALLFIVLGPFQFMQDLRRRRPVLHRWMGRVFVTASLVVGVSALVMSPQMAIGGANETAATMFFGIAFLFCLVKGFLHIRRRNVRLHREWMIRTYAIGLAVATIRPIVGIFFATQKLTGLSPQEFFGIAFWIGFTGQLLAAEAWIQTHRPRVIME